MPNRFFLSQPQKEQHAQQPTTFYSNHHTNHTNHTNHHSPHKNNSLNVVSHFFRLRIIAITIIVLVATASTTTTTTEAWVTPSSLQHQHQHRHHQYRYGAAAAVVTRKQPQEQPQPQLRMKSASLSPLASSSSSSSSSLEAQPQPQPPQQHLVLVGGGHAHVQVIKALRQRPAHLRVTLIDATAYATYSGMVTGYLAGEYTDNDHDKNVDKDADDESKEDAAASDKEDDNENNIASMTKIPIAQLAAWANVDFIQERVVDIDVERKLVYTRQGGGGSSSNDNDNDEIDRNAGIAYDTISIDIGSTSRNLYDVPGALQYTIATRPIDQLVKRLTRASAEWAAAIQQEQQQQQQPPARLVVVGAGAAGLELAMSLQARWTNQSTGGVAPHVTLVHAHQDLMPNESAAARRTLHDILQSKHIEIIAQATVSRVEEGALYIQQQNDGDKESVVPFDYAVWATGAAAHPLAFHLKHVRGLDVTDDGWIQVDATLQSTSHPSVFAAGDCASITVPTNSGDDDDEEEDENGSSTFTTVPKAGVYAVRAGPILIENLTRYLEQQRRRQQETHQEAQRQSKVNNNNNGSDSESEIERDSDLENYRQNKNYKNQQSSKIKDTNTGDNSNDEDDDDLQLEVYEPQDDFMKLLVCGHGRALGLRFGLAFYGPWVWKLKDSIDRDFVKLFDTDSLRQQSTADNNEDHKDDDDNEKEDKKYDTSQYDAADDENLKQQENSLPTPAEAAALLQRTDDQVDYQVARRVLRYMNNNAAYREAVLAKHPHTATDAVATGKDENHSITK